MKTYESITHSFSLAFSSSLASDLDAMERDLRDICSEGGMLAEGLTRINSSGGKRLRPLLARICWSIGTGAKRSIVPLMTMLELMHTASLIHDDIVDDAAQRRGTETISHREGRQQALRSGDYLLSRAMERLKLYRGTGINEHLSYVAQEMCLGELDQNAGLFRARDMTEDVYFSRIRRKTALLMAAACRCGAIAGGGDEKTISALTDYGEAIGMAFQIRDDILDWQKSAETGKAPLQDLRSGVITLPAIYAMEQCPMLAEMLEGSDAETDAVMMYVEGAFPKAVITLEEMGCQVAEAVGPLPESDGKRALVLLAKMISEVREICQK